MISFDTWYPAVDILERCLFVRCCTCNVCIYMPCPTCENLAEKPYSWFQVYPTSLNISGLLLVVVSSHRITHFEDRMNSGVSPTQHVPTRRNAIYSYWIDLRSIPSVHVAASGRIHFIVLSLIHFMYCLDSLKVVLKNLFILLLVAPPSGGLSPSRTQLRTDQH